MSDKNKNPRRAGNLLLAIHIFLYAIFWALALLALGSVRVADYSVYLTRFIAVILLWLPLLVLHVSAHQRSGPQSDAIQREREAYREGFADAAEQFMRRQSAGARLAQDDEGELVEVYDKPKRFYSD